MLLPLRCSLQAFTIFSQLNIKLPFFYTCLVHGHSHTYNIPSHHSFFLFNPYNSYNFVFLSMNLPSTLLSLHLMLSAILTSLSSSNIFVSIHTPICLCPCLHPLMQHILLHYVVHTTHNSLDRMPWFLSTNKPCPNSVLRYSFTISTFANRRSTNPIFHLS